MSRPRTDMRKIREVLRLTFGERLSRRRVGQALGLPSTTVFDYVKRAAAAGLATWPLPWEMDDRELERRLLVSAAPSAVLRPLPDWERVHKELSGKGVTLQLLHLEYLEQHPGGYQYSQFWRLYRQWQRQLDVVMRQEHRAGEKLFVDFPGQRIPIYHRESGVIAFEVELFVAVLGASNYTYAEASPSQELPYWIAGHVHAFEFLAGCPQIVVPDYVARHIIRVLCPSSLCGRPRPAPCIRTGAGQGDAGIRHITIRASPATSAAIRPACRSPACAGRANSS